MVWLDGQGPGRKVETWGQGNVAKYVYRLIQMGKKKKKKKKVKIFAYLVKAHQRMISTEEDFYIHVDKMTHSVDSSKALSPAAPIITQWAREQSGHGDQDGG